MCNNDPCSFTLMEETTYVCGCNVTTCILDAKDQDGKEILLLSWATITELICHDKDACQEASIYINPDITINGALTTGSTCNPRSAVILCKDEGSCKDSNITSYGVDTTIYANGLNSFDEGSFQCIGTQDCILKCSDTMYTCEDALCGDGCDCEGLLCPDRTESPTKSPVIDTDSPTISDSPTLSPTTETPTISPVIDTEEPTYSESPTYSPVIETEEPTMSEEPTYSPVIDTDSPTKSESPTVSPTPPAPTYSPIIDTDSPTKSESPTISPTTPEPTYSPLMDTEEPTLAPTITLPIIIRKGISNNNENVIHSENKLNNNGESIVASIIITVCFITLGIIAFALYWKYASNKSDKNSKLINDSYSGNYDSTANSLELNQF